MLAAASFEGPALTMSQHVATDAVSLWKVATDTFVPMLRSLGSILEVAESHGRTAGASDLVDARLAPDMFTLAQQVQQACQYATQSVAKLSGRDAPEVRVAAHSIPALREQISRAADYVAGISEAEFEHSSGRDCSIGLPGGDVIEMDGVRFLLAWSLPHFYFHIVAAYAILRHCGLPIGKKNYLSQVANFIRRSGTGDVSGRAGRPSPG